MVIMHFSGGLGNQMFEYALYCTLQQAGANPKIDLSHYGKQKTHNGYELERIFNIKANYSNKTERLFLKNYGKLKSKLWGKPYKERPGDQYIFNNNIPKFKNGFLKGYWQSENYFTGTAELVKQSFAFQHPNDERNLAALQKINSLQSVSIHIRRGDYLIDGRNCVLNSGYWQTAIAYIKKQFPHAVFFVFSDDIHWTKETLQINGAEFVDWNKAENSYWDMFLMSKCKHNIIANSSFSWWAAWLNDNKSKLVLTPQNWMPHFSGSRDLIPKTWIKIKNEF